MTGLLRDTFDELADDEPPMRLAVADLVGRGRRRKAVHRWVSTASVATAVVSVLGLGMVLGLHRPADQPPAEVGIPGVSEAGTSGQRADGPATRPPSTPSSPVPAQSTTPPAAHTDGALPRNDLADPGFETDPVSWAPFGPSTVLAVGTVAHGGTRAGRITTTATTPVVAGVTSRPVLVVTTSGTRYEASCWVRASAAAPGGKLPAYLQVQEYTQDWQRLADPMKSARLELTDAERWHMITVGYTATHTGSQLPLTVFGADMTATGRALLVDDCRLTTTRTP
jgi:hypothetical protein